MAGPEPTHDTEHLSRRLRRLGLDPRPLAGGHTLTARLPLTPEPFESPNGPLRFEWLTFSTAGGEQIKCLTPRPLFYLPLISIRGCESTLEVEQRIRRAWAQRLAELERAERWLWRLGARPQRPTDAPLLEVPLDLDDREARAAVIESERLILPSRGPLSGTPLRHARDRVFEPGSECRSALELELATTARLEALARAEKQRRPEPSETPAQAGPQPVRSHRILLVGPVTSADRALADSLRLRGHRIHAVRSLSEAMRAFEQESFELIVADFRMDRAEGAELVPILAEMPGIARVPVILVDDQLRPARRDAARHIGAAAYLVRPLEVERIEDRLARLLGSPKHRRFKRYPERLAVRWDRETRAAHTEKIGRGGMLLSARWDVPPGALERFEISLPESPDPVRVDAEAVYDGLDEMDRCRIGLRFHGFAAHDERTLIAFLRALESDREPDSI